jgi:transposase-like protein
MQKISYRRHRFHPDIIRRAVWLYFRFTMSYRDVEELLAERGIEVSYETVRRWVHKFGKEFSRRIRINRGPNSGIWHLDEVFVNICGKQMYLWRAVDGEGEVLDILVQERRDKRSALKFLRKLLRRQSERPVQIVTDKFRSYSAAMQISDLHICMKRVID